MSLPSVTDYSLFEKIGTGSYATVYKAFKKDNPREIVAIKCVDTSGLSKSAKDNLVTEINLLKILKHENIVEMKDFFWDEGHIYIVMEYCNRGDLSHFIKRKHKLAENICRQFLQQLALALKYLRNHNVCHMDLKPQNLLLTITNKFILKVADFGFAQYLSTSEQKFSIRGSPLYMAPEILLCHKYDARVDLWSVGVIMYECLFGRAPYSSGSFQELADKIKQMRPIELPKGAHISFECKDLLMSLLKHDPSERISFEDFFNHDFLDLEHVPSAENYEKAVAIIHNAVKLDSEKNYKEAYFCYCDALRYFIPILTNETNIKKKEALRVRVNEYINRAEKLKNMRLDNPKEVNTLLSDASKRQHTLNKPGSLNVHFTPYFEELCALSKSTPKMAGALEIGEVAEQYLAEGNYSVALEKFKSCLNVLVPLLKTEPPGRRRDLLHKQVQTWIKEAEGTKGLLVTKELDEKTGWPLFLFNKFL